VIKVQSKANNKAVYCEALQIDSNFLKSYNQAPRFTISDASTALVIGAWYRASLGGFSPQQEIEVSVTACNSWWGKFRACIDHPQTVVRVAAWLGVVSVALGAGGVALGVISLR
jgi:hypothetical protein